MKLTEQEMRQIIREELNNISEQEPAAAGEAQPVGAGAAQIKKAQAALKRVQTMMDQAIDSLVGLGVRARVNFALSILAPLNLEPKEIILLKQDLDKRAKENK
tara:strand:+ start:4383 stop:4691 length:309 start_codon:yes stop_codon:yes gene_type:complete